MNRLHSLILIFILLIASFLRLYNISNVPPSASLDEVSIGYNAYSILKTGGDEYGNKFPILLRAYDDWRPALYVYLVIPFVKLVGLNVLAVRLPSVILSILTVIATYLLVKEVFLNSKRGLLIAQISSFLLAISPWHIYISRLGHEVNAGLFFVVFAILFFLKAINNTKKIWFLILSFIFFALSLYTYQSEKVFVPIVLILLGIIYFKELLSIKREILISIFLGFIVITPIIIATFSPQALIRFKGTSAFTKNSLLYKESAEKVLRYKNEGNTLGQIIYNRRLVPVRIFISSYLSHLNPKFLFFNSGNESFKAPNFGLMHVWEFTFLILGIFLLFKAYDKKTKWLLISWLLAAFVAPSLTTGAPHAMRAFNVLPVPQIISALGIFWLINLIKRYKLNLYLLNSFYILMALVIIYFLGSFYKQYFYFFPKNQSSSFQYSLRSAIKFVLNNEKSYDKIIFSNRDSLYQSYMFYLFYSKYDPHLYQRQGGTKSGGYAETHSFDKYEFRPVDLKKERMQDGVLYIVNISETPIDGFEFKTFKNLDGKDAIALLKK